MLHCNSIDPFVTLMGNLNWGPISCNDIISIAESVIIDHVKDGKSVQKCPLNTPKIGYRYLPKNTRITGKTPKYRRTKKYGIYTFILFIDHVIYFIVFFFHVYF